MVPDFNDSLPRVSVRFRRFLSPGSINDLNQIETFQSTHTFVFYQKLLYSRESVSFATASIGFSNRVLIRHHLFILQHRWLSDAKQTSDAIVFHAICLLLVLAHQIISYLTSPACWSSKRCMRIPRVALVWLKNRRKLTHRQPGIWLHTSLRQCCKWR